jgi:hypothetical protein
MANLDHSPGGTNGGMPYFQKELLVDENDE